MTGTVADSQWPWNGIASYGSVDVGGVRSRHPVRTHHHLSPFARRIANRLAVRGGVQVSDTDRPAGGD